MALQDEVAAVVGGTLGVTVDPSASMENTPEWTSLSYVNVVCALEERYKLIFTNDELQELNSVENICKTLQAREKAHA